FGVKGRRDYGPGGGRRRPAHAVRPDVGEGRKARGCSHYAPTRGHAVERGEITEVAFLETITDHLEPLLGHRPEMHRFKEIYFEALEPNPQMIELMRELKAEGYRMAMLTNNVR